MKKKIGSSKSMKKYVDGGESGPGDGKFEYNLPKPMVGKVSADTSGYAAGAKKFPATITSPNGNTKSVNVPRRIIKTELNKTPKAKMGGSVKSKKKK
jgi:hypothetical protein